MDDLQFTGETTKGGAHIGCFDSQIWVGEPTTDSKWYNDPSPSGLDPVGKGKYTVLYKLYKKNNGS